MGKKKVQAQRGTSPTPKGTSAAAPQKQSIQPKKLTEEEKAARRAKRATQKSFATLAEEVAVAAGQSPGVVTTILQELKQAIVRSVRKGEVVLMGPDFGVFRSHSTQERKARNPRTGEQIDVPARTLVKFQMGAGLKALMFGETPTTTSPGTVAGSPGKSGKGLLDEQKKMRAEKIARKKALKAAESQVEVGGPVDETGEDVPESEAGGVSDAEIEAILSEEGIEDSF